MRMGENREGICLRLVSRYKWENDDGVCIYIRSNKNYLIRDGLTSKELEYLSIGITKIFRCVRHSKVKSNTYILERKSRQFFTTPSDISHPVTC